MSSEELADELRMRLSNVTWADLSDERRQQYSRAWPHSSETMADKITQPSAVLMPEIQHEYFSWIREGLVSRNPHISDLAANAPIVVLDSFDERTRTRSYHENEPIITLDSGILLFIWLMNKACIYGDDGGEFSANRLACFALLLYASQIDRTGSLKSRGRRQRRIDATTAGWSFPPHLDPTDAASLVAQTVVHEAFALSHEMAHIELGHVNGVQPHDPPIRSPIYCDDIVRQFSASDAARLEMEADNFAVDACVNAYGGHSREKVAATLTLIFRLSRYYVWLEWVLTEGDASTAHTQNDQAARHFQLRNKFRHVVNSGTLSFIHEELEWLERRMELGAIAAADVYKLIDND